jgi:hypothetical protein
VLDCVGVVRAARGCGQQGHDDADQLRWNVLHRGLVRRDRIPHFQDHELVRVLLVLKDLTRKATLRLLNERNNRHQEGLEIRCEALLGFELIDSRYAHRMLLELGAGGRSRWDCVERQVTDAVHCAERIGKITGAVIVDRRR